MVSIILINTQTSMKDKIINILKEKYNITDDLKNRVDQLLECIQDDNVFYNLNEILIWLDDKIDELDAEVKVVNFKVIQNSLIRYLINIYLSINQMNINLVFINVMIIQYII